MIIIEVVKHTHDAIFIQTHHAIFIQTYLSVKIYALQCLFCYLLATGKQCISDFTSSFSDVTGSAKYGCLQVVDSVESHFVKNSMHY